MSATAIPIFADLTNRKLVASSKGGPFSLTPPFHQDKLYFKVQPLVVNPGGDLNATPFNVIDAQNFAIKAVVLLKADYTVLSGPVDTWVTDGATAKLGSIDLHTTPVEDAIDGATSFDAVLQIQFDDGADNKTTIEHGFTIKRTYLESGTPVVLGEETYLTAAEIAQLYVKFAGNDPGASIELIDASNTYKTVIQTTEEGAFDAPTTEI